MEKTTAIEQMSSIKSNKDRLVFLATAIGKIEPISDDIVIHLAALSMPNISDNNDAALCSLRTVYRGYRKLLLSRDVIVRDIYLNLCKNVYPRGNLVYVADLIDVCKYEQALEIASNSWDKMPSERWMISMLFQAIRAAFYIHEQAELGHKLSKELLTRMQPVSKMITNDTYRKYLTALQIDFVFELRLAGWTAHVGADKNLLELIVQQFEHQW